MADDPHLHHQISCEAVPCFSSPWGPVTYMGAGIELIGTMFPSEADDRRLICHDAC
jgi:hypothetical protein